MKSLVILGTADGSVPTYKTAQRLGFRTLGFDRRVDGAAMSLLDEFFPVSTRDRPGVLASLASRDDVAGVLAPSSDAAMPTLRTVADRFGLPMPNDDVIRASVDKRFFRRLCDQLCLPSYRYVTGPKETALAAARELCLPVYVKPVDGTGSRGTSLCGHESTLDDAVTAASDASYRGHVIVEERARGDAYTVEGFVDDGRLAFAAVARRTLTPPPHAATTSYTLPSGLPDQVHDRLLTHVEKVCRALDYRRGPVDVDAVVDGSGRITLIEFGARIGGSGLTEAVRVATGVDVVAASIHAAVDLPVDLSPAHPPRPALLRILHAETTGVVSRIRRRAEVAADPCVHELAVFARPGQKVAPYVQAANKLGYVLLTGDTTDQVTAAADRVARTLRITVADTCGGDR